MVKVGNWKRVFVFNDYRWWNTSSNAYIREIVLIKSGFKNAVIVRTSNKMYYAMGKNSGSSNIYDLGSFEKAKQVAIDIMRSHPNG